MTPEEGVEAIIWEFGDALQHVSREALADAIRELVAAERERCAKLADELDATYETREPNIWPPGSESVGLYSFADRIREGKP